MFSCVCTIGFDGFTYTSVPFGNRNVTVRGTAQDGTSNQVILSPLMVVPPLTVTATLSASGTRITVTIEANQDATFECQLDDQDFISCKQKVLTITTTCNYDIN